MEETYPTPEEVAEEIVERAFLRSRSIREKFNILIQDLVVMAEEINKDGRTPENWDLFEKAQKELVFFILIYQSHIVFE